MIHREKGADGADVFHAYALRDDAGHVWEMTRIGTFPTSEAAKDAVAPDLAKRAARLAHSLQAFVLFLEHEGWERLDCDEFQVALLRDQANQLKEDGYFLSTHAESVFQDCTVGTHHDGVVTLYGPAAVEYARRHGHQVTHGKYGADDNHEFLEQVTPGRAHELLPTIGRRTFLKITIPRDAEPDDLPPDLSPLDYEKLERKDPASLRKSAADSRRAAKDLHDHMLARADELERLAAEREATVGR
jgi:hypothetical protein